MVIRKQYPARTPLPPGYVVERVDDHWCWVRLADDIESAVHWNHWACWRGAWAHYRETAPTTVALPFTKDEFMAFFTDADQGPGGEG